MARIQNINAVFIYAKNMDRMRGFYEKTLHLGKPVIKTEKWVEFPLNGAHLALHRSNQEWIDDPVQHEHSTVKFSMEVDNIDQYCKELEKAGVDFTIPLREDYNNSRLAEFHDPEGNLLRVIEHR